MSSNAGGSQFWQELRVINPAALQQQLYSWQEDIWAGLPELIHESSQWQVRLMILARIWTRCTTKCLVVRFGTFHKRMAHSSLSAYVYARQ